MSVVSQRIVTLECPGCGNPNIIGPFEAAAGTYYECHDCERHIEAEELNHG